MQTAAKLLLQIAPALGATSVRVTSAKRSRAQQTALYKTFLAGKAAYPVAPPGHSKHELGLAVDIVVTPPSVQAALGHWWEAVGGTWGGEFKDPIHFEI
jgi:LAS superfamily LD-carboxypeptidase LdcB